MARGRSPVLPTSHTNNEKNKNRNKKKTKKKKKKKEPVKPVVDRGEESARETHRGSIPRDPSKNLHLYSVA